MAVYGCIPEFDAKNDDFDEYRERLDQYFIANDIANPLGFARVGSDPILVAIEMIRWERFLLYLTL